MKNTYTLIIVMFSLLTGLTGCSTILLNNSLRLEREADTLLTGDRVSEALLSYHQAITADPTNHSAILKLIPLYMGQGRIREADFLYKQLSTSEQAGLKLDLLDGTPQDSDHIKFFWINDTLHDEPIGLAADEDSIVVGYLSGKITLLNLKDGSIIWTKDLENTITSPPELSASHIAVGCETGEVVLLDRKTGDTLWTEKLPGAIYARPLLIQDRLYAGSYNGRIIALDQATGNVIWGTDVAVPAVSQPILQNDTLFFTTLGGSVHAINKDTGFSQWSKPAQLEGGLEASPILAGNMLLVAGNNSRLTALDQDGSSYYWQYSMPDGIYASPIVRGDQVFVFSIGQTAAMVGLKTGEPLWEKEIPVPVRSKPVLVDGTIYFAGVSQPYLFEMNASNGEISGKVNTGDWIEAGPILQGKTLLLAGKDGAVLAFKMD